MKRAVLDTRTPTHPRRNANIAPIHRVDEDAHLGQFIPFHYHGQMLANEPRMAPFQETIQKLVPLNSHVVELGGGTGVLSFFAAQRARKVTLVERLPHVAAAARRLLGANGVADKVSVVEADACEFVPDEAADVVICEMLHSALLREKQIEVLRQFKANHEAAFTRKIPLIIPEASILAVQPVFQPYDFHGYYAPVPLFFDALAPRTNTVGMGAPHIYATVDYREQLPEHFVLDTALTLDRTGTVNALRFITKNPVGIFTAEARTADWHLPYMCLPILNPLEVNDGDILRVRFQYAPGGSIEALQASIQVGWG